MKIKIAVSIFALAVCIAPVASAVDYEYDALGRLTKADYGDGKVIEYSYDAAGNRMSVVVDLDAPVTPPQPTNELAVVPIGDGFVLIEKGE